MCQGEIAGDAESPLKSQSTNFGSNLLHWAPAKGGQSRLEMIKESLGLVALGRELKEQLQDPCADSLSTL